MKRIIFALTLTISLLIAYSGCNSQNTQPSSVPDKLIKPSQTETENAISKLNTPTVNLNCIPKYSGKPYTEVNNNIPYFFESEHTTNSFEVYSPLDRLKRCGVAYANIGVDIMPAGERGTIGSLKPSGWHTIKYENVDGKYLYNRCHLIGFQLSGENANEQNLITGTRYMNINGMLPFETRVADYVRETRNHVLYRVTPVFEGENLLATGVLIEALSMEDKGEGVCFNVFCYNEQPGIIIDHSNGNSKSEDASSPYDSSVSVTQPQQKASSAKENTPTFSYIGNNNTKRFHYPDCNSVKQMKDTNRVYLNCSRRQALSQNYIPCKICSP